MLVLGTTDEVGDVRPEVCQALAVALVDATRLVCDLRAYIAEQPAPSRPQEEARGRADSRDPKR
jgi:hypothetical protein